MSNEKQIKHLDCNSSQDVNFLDLNDDCLLRILQYLTAKEIVSLIGQLTDRFDELARFRLSHIKHYKFQFGEGHPFTYDELRLLGSHLKSLHISVGYTIPSDEVESLLRPISLHNGTSHLRDITLNYVYMNSVYVECLMRIAGNLTRIDFSHCNLTDKLMEEFFTKCCKLENLILLANYEFGGESLRSLQGMRSIVIEKHEKWLLNFDEMTERNPILYWIVHPKGRSTALVRVQN